MRTGISVSCDALASARSVRMPLRLSLLSRLADYAELTRPRIALLALLTVSLGYSLAVQDSWRLEPLLHALFGVGLVAAACSAWNQLLERRSDAEMTRTCDRPLPSGRISCREVFLWGALCAGGGCLYLLLWVNAATALLACLTLLLYVGIYTPLKRRSRLCTLIGAAAGALPPVIGWTAAGAALDSRALALFLIMYVWQFPHVLAIAWLYRADYHRAGLKMLPARHPESRMTGVLAVVYALVLVPVSLLPSELAIVDSLAGGCYTAAAVVLGLGYAAAALRFSMRESERAARNLIWTSLVYLPSLLLVLTYDHFLLAQ